MQTAQMVENKPPQAVIKDMQPRPRFGVRRTKTTVTASDGTVTVTETETCLWEAPPFPALRAARLRFWRSDAVVQLAVGCGFLAAVFGVKWAAEWTADATVTTAHWLTTLYGAALGVITSQIVRSWKR